MNIEASSVVSRIIAGIVTIFIAVFLNWMFLPAWNIRSGGFWWYWIVVGIIAIIIFFIAETSTDTDTIITMILGIIWSIIVVIGIIGSLSSSTLFNAVKYSNLIKIEEGNFEDEIQSLKEKIEKKVEDIKILLLPKDENDDSNAILEIRSAAGGEESALFCTELCRMYSHYAEKKRWKVEYIDVNETELGGIKEATLMIKGKGAFSRLKYESGVHRVQRVPETESQGRIHTSTSTVAVLPEVEDVDFEILDKDLRIDVFHSGGAGGQNVNKVETAIRITYLPLNIVVTCQDERSQLKNKEKAMAILKSKLYDYYEEQRNSEYDQARKNQVGRGNRNERIRTYNYPQGRVTDHRTNLSSYDLEGVLNGDLDQFIDAMILKERTEMLENLE